MVQDHTKEWRLVERFPAEQGTAQSPGDCYASISSTTEARFYISMEQGSSPMGDFLRRCHPQHAGAWPAPRRGLEGVCSQLVPIPARSWMDTLSFGSKDEGSTLPGEMSEVKGAKYLSSTLYTLEKRVLVVEDEMGHLICWLICIPHTCSISNHCRLRFIHERSCYR